MSSPASLATPQWQSGFADLGQAFFTYLPPTPIPDPVWAADSPDAAQTAGIALEWLRSPEGLRALAGNAVPAGTYSYASVYSGHQFGVWAGQLGDGRAITLGETQAGWEIQLKGAGRTPYSRGGDGRAVLRSSIREFLASEAMHHLGVPTTRALALITSPLPVQRETTETAAIVTRAAPSMIRFGHFEHFAARDQIGALRRLADYVIERYYPECRSGWTSASGATGNAYAALLHAVGQRTAHMLGHWQVIGFCHGVMNTDNMSILGLTLDYGPYQFLDAFDPGHICNHSDTRGRYAFNQQPQVAYWNLFCLGQALLPLIEEEDITVQALEAYRPAFARAFMLQMARKLGWRQIPTTHADAFTALVNEVLELMAQSRVDYTIFWRRLSHAVQQGDFAPVTALLANTQQWQSWLLRYQALGTQMGQASDAQVMLQSNPALVLRNHLAQAAIAAAELGDYGEVQALHQGLMHPFDEHPDHPAWTDFPPEWASSIAISCSS